MAPLEVTILPTKDNFDYKWHERVARHWQAMPVIDMPIDELRRMLMDNGVDTNILGDMTIRSECVARFGSYIMPVNRAISTDWGMLTREQLWSKLVEIHSMSHDIKDIQHYNAWLQHLQLGQY